jgi:hypothetical protein
MLNRVNIWGQLSTVLQKKRVPDKVKYRIVFGKVLAPF